MSDSKLQTRKGLPDALQVLLRDYPRDIWTSHRNFDELTRFWLDRHGMFRELMAHIQVETRAFIEGERDSSGFARESARYTGFLLNQLHGHHQVEDVHYFPLLSGLESRLHSGFKLLDSDHKELDTHIHALADETNTLLQALRAGGTIRDAAGLVEKRLTRFESFIHRHLTDEEDLVVPIILHHAPKF